MVVNPSVPAKTVPEFIAYAKANPGKINYGVGWQWSCWPSGRRTVQDDDRRRTWSTCRIAAARPRVTDLLGGQVQVMFVAIPASIEHIKAGKLRALAVTTAARSEALPDVPTVGEFVPGYEASVWFGVGAPKNTPAEIVDKLNKEINAGLADPEIKARLDRLGDHGVCGLARRLRQAHRRRNREVGQGDPRGQHQAGVMPESRPSPVFQGGRYETSPPTISASGRGRCRAAGRVAHRAGASLSVAAGAHRSSALPPAVRTDIIARLIGQWLSERLGQPFVIENRPGAGSNIGTEAVVQRAAGRLHAAAGHCRRTRSTRRSTTSSISISSATSRRSRASAASPYVMVVNPSVPAKTVPEFIAYAKANPGKINMASAGNGTASPCRRRAVQDDGRRRHVHVPYRGAAPALTDLLGGQVQVMFAAMSSSIEYIRAGKLRALAVTTATRSEALPDVPTVGEFVPGYEASAWYGIGAPKNTPAEIVDKLNKEINAGLADPKIKARLADLGATALAGLACRLRQAHRRRNREVGQGGQVRGHQAGVI